MQVFIAHSSAIPYQILKEEETRWDSISSPNPSQENDFRASHTHLGPYFPVIRVGRYLPETSDHSLLGKEKQDHTSQKND